MYLSPLYPREPIITEYNSGLFAPASDVEINGIRYSRGLLLPESKPRASSWMAQWTRPVYPRSEWKDRIEEREQTRTIFSKLVRAKKIPTPDQNGTNFCWVYGPITALICMRAWRNLPYVEYSRESVGAPIKNYRDDGGWGDEALKRIVEVGPMPQNLWPRHVISGGKKYNTAANLLIANQHIVSEFITLQDRNFSQLITALLDDLVVAVGYNWWKHEVCAIDPVVIGTNEFGIRIWNSWGSEYGDQGMAILAESKATPDDAVIPVVQSIAA